MNPPDLRFAVLGPFQVYRASEQIDIGPYKQRLLLATLLCRANTVLPVEQLIELIWEDAPPRSARKNLQAYLCILRKILGTRLVHTTYGYTLQCSAAELDIIRFEESSAQGRKATRNGAVADAASAFAKALALWRGPFLADVPHSVFLEAMSARLADRRLRVFEDWAEAAIHLGDYQEVLDAIDEIADAHPERERLTMAKLIALYRCGRRQEALAYYELIRISLARELGLDPSPQLQHLFRAILSGDSVGIAAGHLPQPRPGIMSATLHPEADSGSRRGSLLNGNPLPRDVAEFTGRTYEIGVLIEALSPTADGGAGALVTGPVGTGKTALAMHAAHIVTSQFTDGLLFVPMRDQHRRRRTAADVLSFVVAALRLDIGNAGVPDASGAWRAWLSGRSVLIVLDDACEESAIQTLLPGQGSSRILVTSRYRMSGIESVARIDLGDLARAEALELIVKIAGFDAVLDRFAEIASYLDRCGRSPLVVRLLARRMRETAGSLFHSDEDTPTRLMSSEGSVTRRYREHFDELPSRDRSALKTLISNASPPFDGAVMAKVLGTGSAAELAIESLVEANWLLRPDLEVTAHAERFHMPPLAYQYALSRL